VQQFGGFDTITVHDGTAPGVDSTLMSYLPHAVYNYYQNGGRQCWIVRVCPAATNARGVVATKAVADVTTPTAGSSFTCNADGAGKWGNDLVVRVAQQTLDASTPPKLIFSLTVSRFSDSTLLETFSNLSMTGVPGTRPVLAAINDPLAGSRYINVVMGTNVDPAAGSYQLAAGVDPGTPAAGDLTTQAVIDAMRVIDSPLIVGFQPFVTAAGVTIIPAPGAAAAALNANGRNNCFVVWDGKPLALATGGDYKADIIALAGQLGAADSYTALYGPWITVPDPSRAGATITVPPSGSVIGMIARVDATVGPWRAPAGTPAVLSTAVAPELRFTETDQGTLNSQNINVIRPVPGSGICVMGARTRKLYGPDRYVSDRRTLIYIEESIKRSTQWAVFENNDQRLWSSLRNAVINLLQPVWESGGLAGNSASDAYFVHCDDTLNNPQVIQSGEVRMEVGLALQFPAEFVVIRVSQFDSGSSIVSEAITI
jgi:hypothetical protein